MAALAALGLASAADFGWVMGRARREWREGDDLSRATAFGISSLYLLAGALIALALVLRPWPMEIPIGIAVITGACLLVAALVLVVLGARPFGSPAELYGVETGGLIEGGIYSVSRNPQYASLILGAVAIAVLGRSALALAFAVVIAGALCFWIVAVEEPHLLRIFGRRYETYRARVPRFFGLRRSSR